MSAAPAKLAFLYGAREAIWPGIVQSLLAEGGVVRAKLLECDAVVRAKLGWSLQEMFQADGRSPEHVLEPVLTSVQIALTEGWRELGVVPDVIGARCGGEFAAAHVAGRLSLDDALEISCRLSRLIQADGVGGRMLSLRMTVPEADALRQVSPAPFTLAADNVERTTIISCDESKVDVVEAFLASRGTPFHRLGVQIAYHNPAVDRWAPAFCAPFGSGSAGTSTVPLYSATARGRLDGEADDGRHFWRVIREPAYVAPMGRAMLRDGCTTFLEVGGFAAMHRMIAEEARQTSRDVRFLESMRRAEPFKTTSAEVRAVLAELGHCGTGPRRAPPKTPASGSIPTPDMFDPGLARDPYPAYATLRQGPDLAYDAHRECWIVHRHIDVRRILRDPQNFSSATASFEHTLLGADGAPHERVRRALATNFSPTGIRRLREEVGREVDLALDALAHRGAGDVVTELGARLSYAMVSRMLGAPAAVSARLEAWIEALTDAGSPAGFLDRRSSAQECSEYLRGHFTGFTAQASPGAVMAFDDSPSGLALDERVDLGLLLIAAGGDTTTSLIGSAVQILLQHPGVARELRREPERVAPFVEEVLRHRSPIQRTWRRTLQATTMGGRSIPAGADVLVLIGAANRDPAKFPDADRFDPSRQPNDHLGFGSGAHTCLGLWLARTEAALAIQGLLRRFSRIKAVGPTDDMRLLGNLAILGPARLDITVHE